MEHNNTSNPIQLDSTDRVEIDRNENEADTTIDDQEMAQHPRPMTLNDIEIELIDVKKFSNKRRSATMKTLGEECFRADSCKSNQGSFTTNRPFSWFEAIRQSVKEKELDHRCEVKRLKKDSKISIIKIRTVEGIFGEIFFSINFGTGVIIVKTQRFEQWADSSFPELMTRLNQIQMNGDEDDQNPDPSAPQRDGEAGLKSSRTQRREIEEKDIEEVWKNIEQIQNAVQNVEKCLGDMTKNLNQSIEGIKERIVVQDNKMKEMDERIDAKISLFSETIDKDFSTKLTKLTNTTASKFSDVKQSQREFQSGITDAISAIKQPRKDDNQLDERVKSLEEALKEVNLDEVKKDLCKLSDEMDIDSASVAALEKNTSDLQKKMDDVVREMKGTEKDLRRWKTLCEERNHENCEKYQHVTRINGKHNEAIIINTKRIAEVTEMVIKLENTETNDVIDRTMESNGASGIQLSDSITTEDVEETNGIRETDEPMYRHDDVISSNNDDDEQRSVMNAENNRHDIDEGESIHQIPRPQRTDTCHEDESTELIFLIDSNGRYFDHRRLWTMKGTQFGKCYTMRDVENFWKSMGKLSRLKYFFISVGTNDLEKSTPHELFTEINKFVTKVWERYPDVKFILSEVTPRTDRIDARVKEVNVLLQQFAQGFDSIFLTKNSNLRDPRNFFPDGKHLKHDIIPLFVSNIKRALREAYGIKRERTNTNMGWARRDQTTRGDHLTSRNSMPQGMQDLKRELLQTLARAFGHFGT